MPIQLDAKLSAFRRSNKGFYITLEISPDCDWQELAAAPLGATFGVAMVAYDLETGNRIGPVVDVSAPASAPQQIDIVVPPAGQQRGQAEKPRRHFHEMSRAQQAGILCADPSFQWWLSTHPQLPVPAPTDAAEAVRYLMGVDSRADIDQYPMKAEKWDRLVAAFRQQTGKEAEVRG